MRLAGRACVLITAIACVLCAGCGSRPIRGEEGAPRAVVLCGTGQDEVSGSIARALNERGYDVLRKSTTLARSRSSMAVYDVRNHPERVDELTRLLHDDLGLPIEVLPFPRHATGGNAVVIWLGPDARPERWRPPPGTRR